MALALYRKYRPATFAEVVGQEHVTDPLRTALAAGRVNHAYLFSGPRGCGKTSSARILARSLNCVHGPTPEPCGECPSCIALAPEGPGSLDVVELDAASHGGVDDTRDLRDRAFYMPAESRYRVFIIDEAHMVTPQGFNALLKIVEEPPEHLVFIFATTEPDKVLTTIRSRTHHYPFRLIAPSTLRTMLERLCVQEGATVEPAVLPLVIRAGGGSARDTLSMLDQLLAGAGPEGVTYRSAVALLGVTDAALLDEVVDALAAGDGASVFGAVDRVIEAGHDPRRFATDLLQRLRDLVVLSAVPGAAAKGLIDAPEDQLEAMTAQADRLGAATATRMAEVLHSGLVDMRGTTSPRLVLELLCARMLLPAAADGDGALLQRLERMERRMEIAAEHTAAAAPLPAPASPVLQPAVSPGATPIPATPPLRPAASPPPAPEPAGSGSTEVPRPAAGGGAEGRPAAPAAAERQRARERRAAPAGPDLGLPAPPTLRSTRSGSGGRPAASGEAPDGDRPADRAPAARPAEPERRRPPERPAASGARRPSDERPVNPSSEDRRPAQGPPERPPVSGASPPPRSDGRPAAASAPEPASSGSGSASPTPATGIDVADVRRLWPEVLAKVQVKRRTTQILLESATVVGLENGVLRLAMPSGALARRVLETGERRLQLKHDLAAGCRAGRCRPGRDHGATAVRARPGPRSLGRLAPARPAEKTTSRTTTVMTASTATAPRDPVRCARAGRVGRPVRVTAVNADPSSCGAALKHDHLRIADRTDVAGPAVMPTGEPIMDGRRFGADGRDRRRVAGRDRRNGRPYAVRSRLACGHPRPPRRPARSAAAATCSADSEQRRTCSHCSTICPPRPPGSLCSANRGGSRCVRRHPGRLFGVVRQRVIDLPGVHRDRSAGWSGPA
ncbi:DNA polymerase III subunit gamma and tau [Nakamurella sp.]|uniref:DNA polymerase III subunit gamma and tau n=1 Tax=Nakamurella sp. TaxID=1869182 RepID=UPI0037838B3C